MYIVLESQFNFDIITSGEKIMKKVAIIMGSDSDLPVLKPAFRTLEKCGIIRYHNFHVQNVNLKEEQ